MPSAFSHFLLASEALDQSPISLKSKLKDHLPLYFFGAQGADFCFLYPGKQNLGAHLHRHPIHDILRILEIFSQKNHALYAYALGYITHYAMDSVFHPPIYSSGGKNPLRHSRIEALLDLYLSNTLPPSKHLACFRAKLPEKDRELLFLLYTGLALKTGATPLKQAAFFRAISLFNATLPLPNLIFQTLFPRLLTDLFNVETLFQESLSKSLSLFSDFEKSSF